MKTKRRLLSILLSLVVVLGLLLGMTLTAYAYEGKPYENLVNTTTTVIFNEKPWYIIADNSTAVNAGTITLLAADDSFGSSLFNTEDKFSSYYSGSVVKGVLDAYTSESGSFASVKDAIADTDLSDVDVTGAKLYLLSVDEANSLSVDLRKSSLGKWWLRTRVEEDEMPSAACVEGGSGEVSSDGWQIFNSIGVRPALKLKLSSVVFSSVNLSGGENATVSGGSTSQNYFDYGTSRSAMKTVTYTAKDGYRFPATSDYYKTTNGIIVTRTSDTVVTVSGTPTAVANVTVPDAAHTHAFIYAGSGATITATCSEDGCTLTDKKATLSIQKPTLSTYGETEKSASATLTGLSDFNTATGKSVAETQIKYVGRDGTVYAESETAPTGAGKYTARITLSGVKTSEGENQSVIASVDYSIKVAVAFDTHGGSEVPVQVIEAGEKATKPADPTKPGNIFGNWYTDDSFNTPYSFNQEVTNNTTIHAKWGEHEVTWQAGSYSMRDVFTGPAPAADSNAAMNMVVNTIKPDGSTADWKTETDASGNVTHTAQFSYPVTLHANGGTINADNVTSYIQGMGATLPTDVTREGFAFAGWYDNSGLTGTAVTAIGTTDTGSKEYWAKWNQAISRTVTFKVVNGAWDDETTADKTVTLTGYEGDTLKLTADQIPTAGNKPNDTYKAGNWDVTPSAETAITAATTYTYTYAQKESISQTVTFKVVNGAWDDETTADKTVTLTGYEGDTLKLTADQIPTAGNKPNDTYKAGNWDVTPSAETAITAATTYTYTYVAKEASFVTKVPEAKTLTYNGQAQALVTAGEATGGTMYYAVTTENTAPTDKSLYATSIPTAVNAGTYYVWYKIAGNENYVGSDVDVVTAQIKPVDKTALKAAITSAVEYYDNIEGNANYTGIATALKAAIDTANQVAENGNAMQDSVTEEILSITAAVNTAKADVKAADQAAAKAVIDKINALPANTGASDKDAVGAARAAYNALTDAQKTFINADMVVKLINAEAQVKATEGTAVKQAADQAAAKAVIDKINALPANAGASDKDAVEAARAAYNALTDAQKTFINADVLVKLINAEAQVKATEGTAVKQAADQAAAKAVIDKINALPANAELSDKDAVEAARTAYNALTDAQKALVPTDVLAKLTNAETQIAEAEEAAKAVSIKKCEVTVKDLVYTGKTIKEPTVTVKYNGKKLKIGIDYTFTYNKKAKSIGAYKLTVKGMGKYTDSVKVTHYVVPKGTVFTKMTAGRQQVMLKWKNPANITGYQIQYSLKRDFSGSKKVTVKKAKTLTTTIKKLKANKKYYVRIRTYTTVKRKTYYSAWSKAKAVKIKGTAANEAMRIVEATMNVGDELDLKALLSDVDFGSPVTWASSDESVAMVSDEGIAYALAQGEAVITLTEEDGEETSIIIAVNIQEASDEEESAEEGALLEIGGEFILKLDDEEISTVAEETDGEIELESIEGQG